MGIGSSGTKSIKDAIHKFYYLTETDQDKMEFCHDFQNGRCNRTTCRYVPIKKSSPIEKTFTERRVKVGALLHHPVSLEFSSI